MCVSPPQLLCFSVCDALLNPQTAANSGQQHHRGCFRHRALPATTSSSTSAATNVPIWRYGFSWIWGMSGDVQWTPDINTGNHRRRRVAARILLRAETCTCCDETKKHHRQYNCCCDCGCCCCCCLIRAAATTAASVVVAHLIDVVMLLRCFMLPPHIHVSPSPPVRSQCCQSENSICNFPWIIFYTFSSVFCFRLTEHPDFF